MKIASMAAVTCICAAAASFAQSPAPQIPRIGGETVEVSIVNLDVVVTDRKGHRVTGLKKDDFRIVEDGKAQPISNFAEYGDEKPSASGIGASAVTVTGTTTVPAPPRAVIVFVDSFSMPPFKADPVFASLKSSLHSLVRPQDVALIARWREHLVIEQPFTSDLALIDAAVDRAAKVSQGPEVDTKTQLVQEQSELIDFLQAVAARTGTTFTADSSDTTQMFNIESLAQITKWELGEKVKAMNALMSALPPQSKKAMILLSSRMSAFAGAQGFYATNQGPLANEFRDRFNTRGMMQSLVDTAAARGVTIYPMFPEGLRTRSDNPAELNGTRSSQMQNFGTSNYQELQNELTPLQDIADATGGTMRWSTVEVAKALPAIREDLDSYYSLAYRVPPRRDNARHKVVVRAKNSAYTVRSRAEVVERSPAAEMHDRVVAALYTDALGQEIPIKLQMGRARRQGRLRFVIPASVEIPVARLLTVQEGAAKKGAFTVYVASAHAVGSIGDVTKQTVPFTIPPDKASVATFTYTFDLLTDFNTTRVVVAVLDEVSRETGFARTDLKAEQFAAAEK
jgi:VWFA-related protein